MLTTIACFFIAIGPVVCDLTQDEPVCTSRYDYEHKVLRSIVTMELEQEMLNSRIDDLNKLIEDGQEHHKDEIKRFEKIIVEKNEEISALVSRMTETTSNNTIYMKRYEQEKNFIYKDILAQATCRALVSGKNHVNAVRRKCASSYADCNSVCRNVGRTCFNSLHVYDARDMTADVGQIGLAMYRYDDCGGGCGPNYCCCRT